MTNEERLLRTVQRAYRKHHLDDQSIGWDALGDELHNTLAEVMGDKEFINWVKEVSQRPQD